MRVASFMLLNVAGSGRYDGPAPVRAAGRGGRGPGGLPAAGRHQRAARAQGPRRVDSPGLGRRERQR